MYLPRQIYLKHRGHKYWDSETVLENHVWGIEFTLPPPKLAHVWILELPVSGTVLKVLRKKSIKSRGMSLREDFEISRHTIPSVFAASCLWINMWTLKLLYQLRVTMPSLCHHRNNLWNHKPRTLSRLFWSWEFYHSNFKVTKADFVTSNKEINTTQKVYFKVSNKVHGVKILS